MNSLKPCPFCGRKAGLHYYEIDEPFTFTECGYEIFCYHCGIRFKERLSCIPQFDEKADIKKQNLIERWNRRASDGVGNNEADRPQGEWRKRFGSINCSACGKSHWSACFEDLVRSFNYCPNCGARMKGADDETD